MKSLRKAILLIMLCSCATVAMAQRDTLKDTVYKHLPDARVDNPLIVINDHIIGALNVNPNDIKSINVFKDKDNIPPGLKNLGKYGIIMVTLKDGIKVPAKSFDDIKQWLDIKGDVKFAVDGFYVNDQSLLVSTQSVFEINVLRDTKGEVTAINVWTLAPGARKGGIQSPRPANAKPGEIYIR